MPGTESVTGTTPQTDSTAVSSPTTDAVTGPADVTNEPLATAQPTVSATTAAQPPTPKPSTSGDPRFLAFIGVVLVIFFLAVIYMGIKTWRMGKKKKDEPGGGVGPGDEPRGIVTNWPGLDGLERQNETPQGVPTPQEQPALGSVPPGAPTPQEQPAFFPSPSPSPGGQRISTEPGVVPLPGEGAHDVLPSAPPGTPPPTAVPPAGAPAEDDDPINKLLRDLESRPPTPQEQPAAEAHYAGFTPQVQPATPGAAPEPQPFNVPPMGAPEQAAAPAEVSPVSALLGSPQPADNPFMAQPEYSQPASTPPSPYDAMAAPAETPVGSPYGEQPAMPAPTYAEEAVGAPAADPISQILAGLDAASPDGPPPPEPAAQPEQPAFGADPYAAAADFAAQPTADPYAGQAAQPAGGEDHSALDDILARAAGFSEAEGPATTDIADILARASPVTAEAAPPADTGAIPSHIVAAEPLSPADADIKQFEELYTADPSNSSILDFLATEYLDKGYNRRAIFAYEKIIEADNSRYDAFVNLADCQVKLGLLEEAVPNLKHVLGQADIDDDTKAKAEALMSEAGAFADEPAVYTSSPGTMAPSVPTEPGLQPGIEKKTKALSEALEKQEIMTVYGGQDDTGIDAVKEQLDADPNNPMLLDWYAFQLYSNNRIIEAIQQYRRLVTEFDPTPNALYYLGNAYLKLFKYREAKQCWEQLQSDFPRSKLVSKAEKKLERIHALARRELEKRKKGKAAGKKGALGRISPKRVDGKKKKEEPLSAIGSILEQHAEAITAEEEQEPIFTEYVMGDGSGVDEVENLLAADPDNPELLDWAAFMNYTNHNYENALNQYRRVLELNPDNPQAYYYLGSIYARLERYSEAIKNWTVLVEQYPTHKVAAKARPKIEQIKGLADKPAAPASPAAPTAAPQGGSAINDLLGRATEAPAAQPTMADKLNQMTSEHNALELDEAEREELFTQYAQGDGTGADEIEALLAADPDNLQLLDWAAFMNYTAGCYDKALGHYKRCLELDPRNPQTYYYIGSTLARLERYREAEPYWQRLVQHFPDHKVTAKTRPKLEKIQQMLAASQPAAAAAQPAAQPVAETVDVTQLTPAQEQALEQLMEKQTRDIDEDDRRNLVASIGMDKGIVLQIMEGVLPKMPNSPELLDWTAYLNYACGRYDRALAHYSVLLKAQPDSPQAYYYVGIILCQQERFSDAIKYWNVLVKKYPGCKLAEVTRPNLEKLAIFAS